MVIGLLSSLKTQMMEYGPSLLGFGQLLLRWIFWPIYWWIERTPPKRIPKNDNPLLHLSAKTLARKIRNKELSSEEIVRLYIKRIQQVNPILNAIVENRYTEAIEEARAVDSALKTNNLEIIKTEKERPLLGVPMTVKESCGVKGMSLCVGLLSRINEKSVADGKAVQLLRNAGAIPLCVTTTPELCLSWETINTVTGRTVNAYNTHRTSGGSSGGEGALLGAGASVIGVGSDIAGSIRVPCHFNGIFGHKPTGGIVSLDGHYPSLSDEKANEYLVIGPMVRYAEDLTLLMDILAGENSVKLNLNEKVNLSSLKVFYMEELGNRIYDVPVNEEIKATIRKCVKHLGQNCGAQINETKFYELHDSVEMSISVFFSTIQDIPNALQCTDNPKESKSLILETIKSLLFLSDHSLHTMLFYILRETNVMIPRLKTPYYVKALKDFQIKMEAALGTNGVFLFPTFPIPAMNHYGLFTNTAGVSYPIMFNLLGFPATHVPTGLGCDKLPLGVQVVAARNQDRLCMAVAEELQKAFGGWVPPPTEEETQI